MTTKKSKSRKAKLVSKSLKRKLAKKTHKSRRKASVKKQIRQRRPLYKKLILHPFSVFLILCMVVFVLDWTFRVIADSYTVTAEVLAPALQEGATITSLTNNEIVTSAPITISGTCPSDSYVNLYINGLFTGSDFCTYQTFAIAADLFVGENTITAKDFNVTNQQGPTTPSFDVTLLLPTLVSRSSSKNPIPTPTPIVLVSNYYYQTFITNHLFSWQISISGGNPPYSINTSWGDGNSSTLKLDSASSFTITHKYTKPGYYTILVSVNDTSQDQRIMQLATLIKNLNSPSLLSTTPKAGPPIATTYTVNGLDNFFESSKTWLWAAWSSLVVVLLMLISFLLGEREQRSELLKRRATR